ncbi:meiosis protein SPO22/ZIP4 like-domain-containing protein [Amylostereum chailletii]|nr:meiosis protein SPO22/ZIP4 like-domain-containing protein [Amylostereum chailletii]
MSSRKRKEPPLSDPQELYSAIQDLLVRVKTLLNKGIKPEPPLLSDLNELVSLAEQLLIHRSQFSRDQYSQVADTLDREGTSLWNVSSSIRPTSEVPESETASVIAALRLSALRLIEAGLPPKCGIDALVHMLQLASKTGTTLAEVGKSDMASTVLTSAAKYEESLRNAKDPQGAYQQAKAQATAVYYCSRMEVAWKEGNATLAEYMLQKLTENDHERLISIPARDRELLASKLLEIGKSLLSGDRRSGDGTIEDVAHEAVPWLQKAFGLADQLDETTTVGATELKRSILRNLARAYVLSSTRHPEHLTRAEASLKELLASVETSLEPNVSEYQELRWWMLAVLKRRNAADGDMLEAFRSIIHHMSDAGEDVTNILQELRTLSSHQNPLVVSVLQACVRKILGSPDPALSCVDRIILSAVFHCSKDHDHSKAMQDLKSILELLGQAEFDLPKTSATACLMLFWQYGQRHLRAKRYSEAADWYLLGTHYAFKTIADISSDKCHRKAALCHIEQQEFSQASLVVRRCSENSAMTQYVMLLVAVRQGTEDEAIRAVKAMTKAVDFDKKMLLMATRLAHESDLKHLLLSVLQELFSSVQADEGLRNETEAITLIRCMIRLTVRLIADPGTGNRHALIDTLIEYFATANELVQAACAQKRAPLIIKDISWLWRTAYNCANQGCSEWDNSEEKVPPLFDITVQLIGAYCQVVVQVDEEVNLAVVFASFAAASARVFSVRKIPHDSVEILKSTSRAIYACERTIRNVLEKAALREDNAAVVLCCLRAVLVFEAEVAVRLKEWDQLPAIIESTAGLPTDLVDTLEAVADVLWAEKECPLNVLLTALEIILHASLDAQTLSVDKFSRWLRAICTMLLSRNAAPDRLKAVGYVEQALAVLTEHSEDRDEHGETFPLDEREWLMTTSYNTGVECMHVNLLEEARRWFECSAVISRFVPNGEARGQRISETYTRLLSQYES